MKSRLPFRTSPMAFAAFAVVLIAAIAASCSDSDSAGDSDYDSDQDGLIEVFNLEQLNAIRYDLDGDGVADADSDSPEADSYSAAFPDAASNMGCPSTGCAGYELAADLDFNNPDSYISGTVNTDWTTGTGWDPIGDHATPFSATFDGNGSGAAGNSGGYAISNLFIDRSGTSVVGLFGEITGEITGVTLTDASVAANRNVGLLVGSNWGAVRSSAVSGEVSGRRDVGGLVGSNREEV